MNSVVMKGKALPDFVASRLHLWEKYKKISDDALAAKARGLIKIVLNGESIDGIAWETKPLDIVKKNKDQYAGSIVAKVDGEYHDLHRPIEKDCKLELFKFDSKEGKHCFWHSSAHVLGQALELKYGASLTVGPAIEDGFYYDCAIEGGGSVLADDLKELSELAGMIIKEKQPFERIVVSRDDALKMFEYNIFKQELIKKIPEEEQVSLYRSGPLIDLCRGPHLPSTSLIKAFLATNTSGVYWMAKDDNPLLQRVYGVAFPEAQQLEDWKKIQEEASKRDHRVVGKAQELYFFHHYSPGCAFILPHGARIINRLVSFIKEEYHHRGFSEVATPNMFNKELWEKSGHWQNYKENMFPLPVDNTEYALKPMNCPAHCLIFGHTVRSYRELPLRLADFGVLHRNEKAGALTGLMRVRRFQQDDAHIFCATEMIQSEMKHCLEFMDYVYGKFGFKFSLELSTRPEKYLGDIETWNKAEKMIMDALNDYGKPWKVNPGDGAFYGPKIDIHITDAMNRAHQCATIQLDYQLPVQFDLKYTNNEGKEGHPVMIHRAIYGSLERLFAILIEHTAGKWPFWLSPRQCMVIPVSEKLNDYAVEVQSKLHRAGYYVDVDLSDRKMAKKVAEAQLLKCNYNFVVVVGESERESKMINVRARDGSKALKSCDELVAEFAQLMRDFK